VLCFTVVGAWLRLDRLDLMEFKEDEARMYVLASRHAGGQFLPHGLVSGQGLLNPPVAAHLFALVRFWTPDPLALAYLPAALGVVALPLCFALTCEVFGLAAALTATMLFATAPLPALYARKIWAQDLLPPLVILTMACAFRLVRTRQPFYAAAFALLAAAMIQVHYSALVFVAMGVVLMFWVRGWRVAAGWAVGVVLGVLSLAPFLAHEVRTGFRDVHLGAEWARQTDLPPAGPVETLRHLRNLATDTWFRHYVAGNGSYETYDREVARMPATHWAAACLFCAGAALALYRARRRNEDRLLLLWLGLPPLVWSVAPSVAHYQIVALPAPFMAAGLLVEAAWATRPASPWARRAWRGVAVALAACCVAVAVAHAVFFHSFLGYLERNGGTRGDYDLTYRSQQAIAAQIARFAADRSFDVFKAFGVQPSAVGLALLAQRAGAGKWTGEDKAEFPQVFVVLSTPEGASAARITLRGYDLQERLPVVGLWMDVWRLRPRPVRPAS
jgi:hypothetical protein